MQSPEIPCLNLSVDRLSNSGTENFAIWVWRVPYSGGNAFYDCLWSQTLTEAWLAWQEMFASYQIGSEQRVGGILILPPDPVPLPSGPTTSYSSRLMQHLGTSLYKWIFDGPIRNSLAQSQGIAIGQDKPLRLRLEIRAPDLVALPWEIMQPQPGRPAISLPGQLLFSRTTSDVDPLPPLGNNQSLNILLVLGTSTPGEASVSPANEYLLLQQEAAILEQTLKSTNTGTTFKCNVDTLLQPTPEQLIAQLETQAYNIFFYAGHGLSGPDGGFLLLQPGVILNGTELAQLLTRYQVTLCVVNACWGAQPAFVNQQALPRSSLAEVLIHHGVPAVLGMRDEIADRESLSFIQAFTQALAGRLPIDQAVAVARQQLLTLYKFNYPAWTLPVLYLHPEFDGELLAAPSPEITVIPENSPSSIGQRTPTASLRSLLPMGKVWSLGAGVVRVGRLPENDIMIPEAWVSQRHAEIFCRTASSDGITVATYFLRDNSRFGTLLLGVSSWQKVHYQEVPLQSGMLLKFGSSQGETFEFTIEVM